MSGNHDQFRRWLHESFTTGLSAEAHDKLRTHLRSCESCAQLHARYARLEGALYGDPTLSQNHDGMLDRVAARVVPEARERRWTLARVGGPAVLAAALTSVVAFSIVPSTPTAPSADRGPPTSAAEPSFQARAGDAPKSAAVRLVRLTPDPSGRPDVFELSAGGRLGPKDRLAVLYTNRGSYTRLRIRLRNAAREIVVFDGAADPAAADTPATAPIARPDGWPNDVMIVIIDLIGDAGRTHTMRREVRWTHGADD